MTRDTDTKTRAVLLESGADQVLSEPFCGRELLACVWTLTRRGSGDPTAKFSAILGSLKLTPTERLLLAELYRARDELVEVPTLLEAVFKGRHYAPDSSHLRVHMHRLSKKLLRVGLTVEGLHGRGYRLLSRVV